MIYLCSRIKREEFCAAYPDLCQKPDNLTEFCEMHPYFCKDDTSNLLIPKLGYYASNLTEDIRYALMEIYMDDINQDGAEYWSWKAPFFHEDTSKMKTNFVYDYERSGYVTCYSKNLHIYGSEEVETTNSNDSFAIKHIMNGFEMSIRKEESIYPWTVPQIMFSIHSPFEPIYPFYEGEFLQSGHAYLISIRLVSTVFQTAVHFNFARRTQLTLNSTAEDISSNLFEQKSISIRNKKF
ncbi:uncharacterized protein NPIL_193251 [Nephila pilipes]|uniref:Uncharacterized protein n=1 Tax=Nephila pilipes TaxID=299642 RepID=A0A8X6Q0C2_NEPPI|nr:uncharacterized protein NPIL_193251 [Nephila pilipes]